MQFFIDHANVTFLLVIIFSAIIGSFLNVVIYRLPLMMRHNFEIECHQFLNLEVLSKKQINLAWPRSFCRFCEKTLSWWANIPLFSYIFLRGRCQYCKNSIPIIYPLVELITIITTVFLLLHFGFTLNFFAAFILTCFLICIALIDWEHQLVPDQLSLSGLWVGLLFNLQSTFASIQSAVLAAAIAYLSLWLIAKLFSKLRRKEGMGYGDFKVFALLGAWLGVSSLIYIILIASILGIISALLLMLFKKLSFNQPMAFAPYLALAGWICLYFHGTII